MVEKFRDNLKLRTRFIAEFMTGVYDDWAEERRNYFAPEQYWRVLSGLAKLSFAKVILVKRSTSQRNFAADPFLREDVHRPVMKAFIWAENLWRLKNSLKICSCF